MWRLLLAIYDLGWDSLFADQSKNSFRQKVTYKCTPVIKLIVVTNLNKNLKNIKSDIMVDFICQETSGVTIVTNKVASNLDLQTIENYMKNTNHIESVGVEVP